MRPGPKLFTNLILTTLSVCQLITGNLQASDNLNLEVKEINNSNLIQHIVTNAEQELADYPKDNQSLIRARSKCKKHRVQYDYIIVGAGTAGAVLANKLSNNFNNKVLAIEAGENRENDPIIQNPNFLVNFDALNIDPKYSFAYPTLLFQPGQIFVYTTGRGWGGGSMHNYMLAVRGTPDIYNAWAFFSGDDRWTYNNVLPFMKKLETYTSNGSPINTNQRGTSGPLFITQGQPVQNDPWEQAAAGPNGADVGFVIDYNDPTEGVLGFSSLQSFITPGPNGERSYSATAYLPVGEVVNARGKGLNGRKLRIVSKAFTNKVIFRGNKAIGIEYIVNRNGKEEVIQAFGKKIILSAGSINTPAILERSGIGDPAILKPLGIPVIVNNPNVGNHLQNHYGAQAVVVGGLKPNFIPESQAGIPQGFTDGRPFYTDGVRRFQIVQLDAGPGVQLLAGSILNPNSKGSTHIVSTDPTVESKVNLNMYSDGSLLVPFSDASQVVVLYRVLQNIAKAIGGAIVFPTPDAFRDPTGNLLLQAAQSLNGTFIADHACGTTRMAISPDLGVVDGKLRVFGVKNLYVADNGVVPVIEDGNTAYTAFVVGLVLAHELKNKK